MAIGDIYKVGVVSKMHGHLVVNTFHYVINQMPTSGTVETNMLSPFRLDVLQAIKNVQSVTVSYLQIEIQKIWPTPVLVRHDFREADTGVLAVDPMPDTVALVVRRTSVLAGRSKRGRIYVGGVGVNLYIPALGSFNVSAGGIGDDLRAAMIASLTVPATNFSASPVLWGRTSHVFTAVTGSYVDDTPRSQRRRELDVGV